MNWRKQFHSSVKHIKVCIQSENKSQKQTKKSEQDCCYQIRRGFPFFCFWNSVLNSCCSQLPCTLQTKSCSTLNCIFPASSGSVLRVIISCIYIWRAIWIVGITLKKIYIYKWNTNDEMTVFKYIVKKKKECTENLLYIFSHDYIILTLTLLPTSSHFREVWIWQIRCQFRKSTLQLAKGWKPFWLHRLKMTHIWNMPV